jgi:type IV pilus assembly protein PilQ
MTLDVNKDSVGTNTPNAGPPSTPSRCETQVLVENGGTVVIGGIFTQDENDEVNKVPLLGDLPFAATCSRTSRAFRPRPNC